MMRHRRKKIIPAPKTPGIFNKNGLKLVLGWLRITLLNPLVIILPLMGVLWLGWTHYVKVSRDLSMPTHNILPGGSFDTSAKNGIPSGWQLAKDGQLDDTSTQTKGYVNRNALLLAVSHYQSGDLALTTPKVLLTANTTYLFKGFYATSSNFDLLVRYYYADGTSQLQLVHSYSSTSDQWSTVSSAFTTGTDIRAVQFMYRQSSNGHLHLDETYLEATNSVYIAPKVELGKNLLANAGLTAANNHKPRDWISYHSGKNSAAFAYVPANNAAPAYVRVAISDYVTGEAKWQPEPLTVAPDQYFQYSFDYQSTEPADIVVEYVLSNHTHVFDTIATLAPSSDWTNVTTQFEVPSNAINLFPSIVLHRNGSISTTHYGLYDITKPGKRSWNQPLISLTFDGGSELTYQNGAALLQQYNLHGTFYVNPATIDTNNFMNISELKTLQQHGNELASQGYDNIDLTTVNTELLNAELQKSSSYLHQTFGSQNLDFATSYGDIDPQVQAYVRKYYRSNRSTESGINTKQNFNPYDLKIFYIDRLTSSASIQNAIAQTEMYHGWLILVYNRIGTTTQTTDQTAITPGAFAQQLQIISKSGVAVNTIDDALNTVTAQK